MHPYIVDYWPTDRAIASQRNHETYLRAFVLAEDEHDADVRFQQMNIPHSYRQVHDAVLDPE